MLQSVKSILDKQITLKCITKLHKINKVEGICFNFIISIEFIQISSSPCFLILLLSRKELKFTSVHLWVLSTVFSLCLKQTNLFKRYHKVLVHNTCFYVNKRHKDKKAEHKIHRGLSDIWMVWSKCDKKFRFLWVVEICKVNGRSHLQMFLSRTRLSMVQEQMRNLVLPCSIFQMAEY